jgi:Lrp/AsnC family transcriptional regulator, leucine-responsive regulatory protein
MEINDIDRRILMVLQSEGRLTNQQLSQQLNISAASCWRRVRSLEERQIIKGYAALVSREQVDLNLCVFVHVSLSRHAKEHVEDFIAAIKNRPEVLECYATTGDADFMLRVVAEDIAAYDQFLENFIFGLSGISQVKSNIALREIKHEVKLPLDKSA